jgi:hypothetical protein
MPKSRESSGESVANSSTDDNHAVDSAAQVAASDSPGITQVEDSQPPHGSFGQTRGAAKALLGALRQDLQASSAWAKIKTAAVSSMTKLRSTRLRVTSAPRMTTALVRVWRGIRDQRSKPRESRQSAPRVSAWWKFAMGLALLVCLLAGSVLVWALKDVPWSEIQDGTLKPVVVLETADGAPLVRQGPYQGPYAQYDQFPPNLVDAVLSIEDRRFMDHFGVDLRGIGRAFLRNLEAGSVVEGGSTITQQDRDRLSSPHAPVFRSARTQLPLRRAATCPYRLEWLAGRRSPRGRLRKSRPSEA